MNVPFWLISVLLLWSLSFSQTQSYKYRYLTVEDGLSQNLVRTIIMDQAGFLWFGTADGLNRYDGYQFKIYRYNLDDSTSLSDNAINVLKNDSRDGFWVGTVQGGLDYYDPAKDEFRHFGYPENTTATMAGPSILAIAPQDSETIWVGTRNGLWQLNTRQRAWKRVALDHNSDRKPHLVTKLFLDVKGQLWIGTEEGLFRRNPETGKVNKINQIISGQSVPFTISIRSLHRDPQGDLWAGTHNGLFRVANGEQELRPFIIPVDGDPPEILSITNITPTTLWFGTARHGIYVLEKNQNQLTQIPWEEKILNGLRPSGIHAMVLDRDGLVWLGTRGIGLQVLNTRQIFTYYPHIQDDDYSLSSATVRGIYLSRDSVLWVGGYVGLDGFDRKTGTAVHYRYDPRVDVGLPSENIYSILEDDEGFLWLGTEGQGIIRLNPKTGKIKIYYWEEPDSQGLNIDFVYHMIMDSGGDLWFGTEKGVLRLKKENRNKGIFEQIAFGDETKVYPNIRSIAQDDYGNIWAGTEFSGLGLYNPATNRFRWIRHAPNHPRSISDNRILCILPSTSGALWIGTNGGGLNKMDYSNFNVLAPQKTLFTHYGVSQGLISAVVYGVLEDDEGYLWLSTNAGIWRMNPATETFQSFPLMAGQQNMEFNREAWHKGWNGEFFFGGINGLNSFFPEDVVIPEQVPPLAVSNWQRLTTAKNIDPQASAVLPIKSYSFPLREANIYYTDLSLTIQFAVLSYLEPKDNHYRYRIVGLFDDWVDLPPGKRDITLTHLPPGNYQLEVAGSNAYGVWNHTGQAVSLNVYPAPWNSWWARLIYLLGLAVMVFAFVRSRLSRVRKYTLQLKKEVAEATEEIRRREHRLADQNLFLESVIESLTYPFYVVEVENYTLVMANSAARKWGRSDANTCYALQYGQEKPCVENCPLRELDKFREHRVKRKKVKDAKNREHYIEIHSHPIFSHTGEIKHIIEYYLDISDQIKLELSLQRNLEGRNRELTTQALKMARNQEAILNALKRLQPLTSQLTGEASHLLRGVESSLKELISKENEWEEFDTWFREVHENFYSRLTQRIPDLTSRERKICAFLKLNLNTKEIASLTNLSVKSIEVYRSRLRKRLGVPAGENLVQFIHNL